MGDPDAAGRLLFQKSIAFANLRLSEIFLLKTYVANDQLLAVADVA
jgi:hypothetical protein